MAVEILSPSTSRHDTIVKMVKYLKTGVQEYWVVDIESKCVKVHILENGKYVLSVYEGAVPIPVRTLPGCTVIMPE